MPYFVLDGAGIYHKLNGPAFHCIAFSMEGSSFQAMKNGLETRYSELVDFNADQ